MRKNSWYLNLTENFCWKQDVVGNLSCGRASGVSTGLVTRCSRYKNVMYKQSF